jgi:hypothetical protein
MYQNIMLKGLSLFNKCAYYFSSIKEYLYHTYEHVKQCLTNYDYSFWIFLPGHSLPLPLSLIKNPITYYWKYDTYTNQLIHHSTKPLQPYVLSILSAKLRVTASTPGETKEYDMDPFLETFRVHTDAYPPTLKMILMSWCAQHKTWFPANCPIHMEYIDHLGNFINVNLADEPIITIQQNKLYISCSSSSQ